MMILNILLLASILKNILGLNKPASLSSTKGIGRELLQQRNTAREFRIQELQHLERLNGTLSKPESNELKGLLSKGDTYNPYSFSSKHNEFKNHHNEIFHYLSLFNSDNKKNPKLFYLDGVNGGTTSCLLKLNHVASSLYTANKYFDSYEGIKEVAKHYIDSNNEGHDDGDDNSNNNINILLKSAEWALSNSYYNSNQEKIGFGEIDFDGYYFDGCGGGIKMIIDLIKYGPLSPTRNINRMNDQTYQNINKKVVVGFTLTNAYHDGSSIHDREQLVMTAIHRLIQNQKQNDLQDEENRIEFHNTYNYVYRVADQPQNYGLPDPQYRNIRRFCDGALTTWLVLSSNPIR